MNEKGEEIFGILFRVCDSICSVPIQSIIAVEPLTEFSAQIPRTPNHVLGMCKFHGEHVNIVDLGELLGLDMYISDYIRV